MLDLRLGNNFEIIKEFGDNTFDSIVTDPPYGLGKEPDSTKMLKAWLEGGHYDVTGTGFLGHSWDAFVPQPAFWRECLRVLKPGGYILAFAGTRTQDLMGLGLRIAGFEIRDVIAWVYGSGFPKNFDVSRGIDNELGVSRDVIGIGKSGKTAIWNAEGGMGEYQITEPKTEAAKAWEGWGTALKPAYEPIIIARKSIAESNLAKNVMKYGVGGLNIGGCRIPTDEATGWQGSPSSGYGGGFDKAREVTEVEVGGGGRWPANFIHDGEFETIRGMGGEVARYFYGAKASQEDREEGLRSFLKKDLATLGGAARDGELDPVSARFKTPQRANIHPTVKPTDLMRWLVRLVTPRGGHVLDPYMGSGSTGKAAMFESLRFTGFELDPEYFAIAEARCRWALAQATAQPSLF